MPLKIIPYIKVLYGWVYGDAWKCNLFYPFYVLLFPIDIAGGLMNVYNSKSLADDPLKPHVCLMLFRNQDCEESF